MDDALSIHLTDDTALIRSVMTHPIIFDVISEDGVPVESLALDMDCAHLVGCVGGRVVGLMIVEPDGQLHIHVLPDERRVYANSFAKLCFGWAWNNTGLDQLYAKIPTLYENVLSFARKLGFSDVKTHRQDWLKGGRFYDSIEVVLQRPRSDRYGLG